MSTHIKHLDNTDKIEIAQRLKQSREKTGLSQSGFANSIGFSVSAYQNYEQGIRPLPVSLVRRLYSVHSVGPLWLLSGVNQGLSLDRSSTEDMIPIYNVCAAAGSGAVAPDHERVDALLSINISWLRREFGVNPNKLAAIEIIGDSMEPLLRPGEIAVLHTGSKFGDGIFCLRYDDDLVIKRVQRMPHKWRISSVNEAYPPYEISKKDLKSVVVIGQLIITIKRI